MKIISTKTKSPLKTFKVCPHRPRETSKKMILNWPPNILNNWSRWSSRGRSRRISCTHSEQFYLWPNKTRSTLCDNRSRTL